MPHDPDGHAMHDEMHDAMYDEMERCIENCTECHMMCEATLAYCVEMGGEHAQASHIRALMDCAQACTVSADFMLHDSELHPQMCGVCAEACARCARSCDGFDDDEQMKACADMCRECAESCRQMAGTETMGM